MDVQGSEKRSAWWAAQQRGQYGQDVDALQAV